LRANHEIFTGKPPIFLANVDERDVFLSGFAVVQIQLGAFPMNEISQLLQQRFGLSPDQAQEAENAVIELLKSKVPPQFQGILESVLGGQAQAQADGSTAPAESGGFGGLLSAAEGLIGAHNG
jgi:hypothetical protein